jgi:hypothetical protein
MSNPSVTPEEMATEMETMRLELDRLKKATAGQDRAISKYQTQIQELEAGTASKAAASDPQEGALERAQADLAEVELKRRRDDLDRRERAIKLALDRNIDTKEAYRFLGLDDKGDAGVLDAVLDDRQRSRNEFLRRNGRTPAGDVKLGTGQLTMKKLERMSDAQVEALPAEALAEFSTTIGTKSKQTVGQKLHRDLFGGEK